MHLQLDKIISRADTPIRDITNIGQEQNYGSQQL